jgi:hypothetical protein
MHAARTTDEMYLIHSIQLSFSLALALCLSVSVYLSLPPSLTGPHFFGS